LLARFRPRITYANVTATLALVLATGGGAYAAVSSIPGSDGVIRGCYQKKKGNLRLVRAGKKCSKGEKAIAFNQRGRQGVPGPQGPAGTPDTSAFYTKTASDARFLLGAGQFRTIPLVDLPNSGSGPLVDVAGVGKLEVTGCALGNSGFRYTNESTGDQNYVLFDSYHTRNNLLPDAGTVAAGATFTSVNNDSRDIVHLTLSDGTRIFDVQVTQMRTASSHCLYWGRVYSG
jgi:hypothetical protein